MRRRDAMHDLVHSGPTSGTQALRALMRYPERVAFVSGSGQLSFRAALDLIGRMQAALDTSGLRRSQRLAILTANRGEAWCASTAAQLNGMSITWLHPLASL